MAVSGVTAVGLAVALAAMGAAAAGVTHAVGLPDAACNEGTETAHASIPEETGTGVETPGHMHVPELGEDGCSTGVDSE